MATRVDLGQVESGYTVNLAGGSGNTTGYRLICTIPMSTWSNFQYVMIVKGRHSGAGILTIGVGCRASSVSFDNIYAEIKYFGITEAEAGGIIAADSFQIYVSSDGSTAYLFWKFWDYGDAEIQVNGFPTNPIVGSGAWVTSIGSTYGTLKAQTVINSGGSSITVDSALSSTSTNPVQNKVITNAINNISNKALRSSNGTITTLDDLSETSALVQYESANSQSHNNTGYEYAAKIGALELRWGTFSIQPSKASTTTSKTITFKNPFPNSCHQVQLSINGAPEINTLVISCSAQTANNFTARIFASNTTSRSIRYFAIGS